VLRVFVRVRRKLLIVDDIISIEDDPENRFLYDVSSAASSLIGAGQTVTVARRLIYGVTRRKSTIATHSTGTDQPRVSNLLRYFSVG